MSGVCSVLVQGGENCEHVLELLGKAKCHRAIRGTRTSLDETPYMTATWLLRCSSLDETPYRERIFSGATGLFMVSIISIITILWPPMAKTNTPTRIYGEFWV